MPLKEKTKRLDSRDCPLEAGVAFPFDLVQLWLLLTSSSHALSQGCVRSLSTVREVEISHVDRYWGGWSQAVRMTSVLGVVSWLHEVFWGLWACWHSSSHQWLLCQALLWLFLAEAFFVTQRNSPTGSFLLALKGTREAWGHGSELWGLPLFQFQTFRLLRRIAIDVKTQFCEQKENRAHRPCWQMFWPWLCASMRWSPWQAFSPPVLRTSPWHQLASFLCRCEARCCSQAQVKSHLELCVT